MVPCFESEYACPLASAITRMHDVDDQLQVPGHQGCTHTAEQLSPGRTQCCNLGFLEEDLSHSVQVEVCACTGPSSGCSWNPANGHESHAPELPKLALLRALHYHCHLQPRRCNSCKRVFTQQVFIWKDLTCTAARPTPPVPAWTSTCEPGPQANALRRASSAVTMTVGVVEAWTPVRIGGTGTMAAAGACTWLPRQPTAKPIMESPVATATSHYEIWKSNSPAGILQKFTVHQTVALLCLLSKLEELYEFPQPLVSSSSSLLHICFEVHSGMQHWLEGMGSSINDTARMRRSHPHDPSKAGIKRTSQPPNPQCIKASAQARFLQKKPLCCRPVHVGYQQCDRCNQWKGEGVSPALWLN